MGTRAPRAWIAGVTGGIGSGKSVFARLLAGTDGRIVDADRAARALADSDDGVRSGLAGRFGEAIFNASGALDRSRLAELAFGDPARLEALNRIVWPALARDLRREIGTLRAESPGRPIVLDMAVLFETGCDALCDAVVAVRAPVEERIRRIREARGWDEAHIRQRMKAQMQDAVLAGRSDFTVDNDGTTEDLLRKAMELRARLDASGSEEGPGNV
jgi:dephospho-CoA kinase